MSLKRSDRKEKKNGLKESQLELIRNQLTFICTMRLALKELDCLSDFDSIHLY